MPANTYTLIEKIVVGAAGASSITFTSIPQTYTDLKVVISVRDATNNNGVVKITFNGSATGYTARQLYGTGSSAASDTNYTGGGTYYGTEGSSAPSNATASTFSNCEFYIPNYTSSNNKSISADSLYENNASLAYQSLSAGLWSNSAAITSITVTQFSGNNFAQYSTAYLYGIAKEGVSPSPSSAPYATGGDRIVFDGTYWYHAFTSSGTFTPRKGLSCDVLVVAGGGGSGGSSGGNYASGGGGAGGYLKHTSQSLTATNYTVTVGAGGAGATVGTNNGNKGSDSQFASLTASVGGGLGGANTGGTNSGGSGGGSNVGSSGGAATSGQGNAGGAGGPGAANYTGGGGGGAGAVGAAGTSTNGGNGGAGTNTDSSWLSATGLGVSGYIAGGGGGASWGAGLGGSGGSGGGGGGGGNSTRGAGIAGTANTGSGGGGGGNGYNGASGGSGIVIVRYAA